MNSIDSVTHTNSTYQQSKRYITFTPESLRVIDTAFDLAQRIWGECSFETVRVLAGNVSAFGRFLAKYRPSSRLIEIPLNPSFCIVHLTPDGIAPQSADRMLGVMLHELGHHAERHHPAKPWRELHLTAGRSTHATPSWCWVCATGWNHFFPGHAITPDELAFGVRHVPGAAAALARFEPNRDPAKLIAAIRQQHTVKRKVCSMCGAEFEARASAVFCSTRCRVAAHRRKRPHLAVAPLNAA